MANVNVVLVENELLGTGCPNHPLRAPLVPEISPFRALGMIQPPNVFNSRFQSQIHITSFLFRQYVPKLTLV